MKEKVNDLGYNLHRVKLYQMNQRMLSAFDESMIQSNNSYVMIYSIIQTIVILVSFAAQTFFIKKLFESPVQKSFNSRA